MAEGSAYATTTTSPPAAAVHATLYLAFSAAFLSFIVIERVLNAIFTLVSRIIWSKDASSRAQCALLASAFAIVRAKYDIDPRDFDDPNHALHVLLEVEPNGSSEAFSSGSAVKGYASMQVLGSFVTLGSAVASATVNAMVSAFVAISGFLLWAGIFGIVFALLFYVQKVSPGILVQAVEQYNDGYGPLLHRIVFIPLQVVDVMFSAVVPLYNAVLKLLRILFIDVLVDSLVANASLVGEFGAAFAAFCKHAAVQIPPYVERIATKCDYAKEGDLCYEPGNGRVLDLITVMADVRSMDASLAKLLLGVCASAAAPLNIVMFPLMDINLAKAVHNMLNAVLYTILQLPSVTAQRCINHGEVSEDGTRKGAALLMCIPDMSPPINMLVAGMRDLGIVVDNWIDVSSIIAQRTLRIISDDEATCEQQAKSLSPAFYSRQLFSNSANNRPKIVVGLTPGLYAITDGRHAQYFNHYDSVDTIASPYVWPIEIDTRYGVAAVTYRANSGSEERDASGETTTTMMGCRLVAFLGEHVSDKKFTR